MLLFILYRFFKNCMILVIAYITFLIIILKRDENVNTDEKGCNLCHAYECGCVDSTYIESETRVRCIMI